jgi:hypothetical protein
MACRTKQLTEGKENPVRTRAPWFHSWLNTASRKTNQQCMQLETSEENPAGCEDWAKKYKTDGQLKSAPEPSSREKKRILIAG